TACRSTRFLPLPRLSCNRLKYRGKRTCNIFSGSMERRPNASTMGWLWLRGCRWLGGRQAGRLSFVRDEGIGACSHCGDAGELMVTALGMVRRYVGVARPALTRLLREA